jgi:hypothetical protein
MAAFAADRRFPANATTLMGGSAWSNKPLRRE